MLPSAFDLLMSWRRLTGPDRALAILTILAVAASVTLATALEMASRSAQEQIARTAEAVIGSAKIEVLAGTVGIPESLLETVGSTPGVLTASAMISAPLRLPGRDFALQLVGVDFLAQEQVRAANVRVRGVRIRDPIRLMALPNAILVTGRLLDRLGLPHDWDEANAPSIVARHADRDLTLSVRGLLDAGGLGDAFAGQVAVMDVYALQELLGRRGWFDRIDVVPEPDRDVDELVAEIGARIHGIAHARRSAFQTQDTRDMLAALRLVFILFTSMVTTIAALLTYGAMTVFSDLKRRQLFVLRAAGMEAARAQQGLVLDVSVLALIGTALGWVSGLSLASPLLRVLSEFIQASFAEELSVLSVGWVTVLVALVSGVLAAIAGGTVAARRVGRRFLLDVLEPRAAAPAQNGRWQLLAAVAIAAAAALVLSRSTPAMIRVAVVYAAGLAAVLAFAGSFPNVAGLILTPLRYLAPGAGAMAGRSFAAAPWTFAVIVTAVAGSTGAMNGLFLLTESASDSFVRWTTSLSSGAISIRAGAAFGLVGRELVSPQTVELIRATPGVLAACENYDLLPSVYFRGQEVSLQAATMDVLGKYGRLGAADRLDEELARDLAAGAIAISTGFARHFEVKTGDRISVDTPRGPKEFLIAGQVVEYGLPTGTILMDLTTYDSYWHRAGAWSVKVWTAEPSSEVVAAIAERAALGKQELFFVDEAAIISMQASFARQFVGPLNVAGALVAALAAVGVAFTLIGVTTQRRRELAVLRASGAEPRHVIALVLFDSLAIAVLGVLFGLVLGYACAPLMTDVLREASGWDIDQRWFSVAVPAIVLGALGVALVGATLPARIAFRTLPTQVLAPE